MDTPPVPNHPQKMNFETTADQRMMKLNGVTPILNK
jgi:hypothetical protein